VTDGGAGTHPDTETQPGVGSGFRPLRSGWQSQASGGSAEQTTDERRKVAMAVVIEELGSASLGMLPDGRVLHHTIETREFPALPAKVVSWDRLTEAVLG
jgi:hypothetical protein